MINYLETSIGKYIEFSIAIDASGTAEKINLLANFGTFFLGELWDTYSD